MQLIDQGLVSTDVVLEAHHPTRIEEFYGILAKVNVPTHQRQF